MKETVAVGNAFDRHFDSSWYSVSVCNSCRFELNGVAVHGPGCLLQPVGGTMLIGGEGFNEVAFFKTS